MSNIQEVCLKWKTNTRDDNYVSCSAALMGYFIYSTTINNMCVVIDRHTKNLGHCFSFSLQQFHANTRYLADKRLLKGISNHSIWIPLISESHPTWSIAYLNVFRVAYFINSGTIIR